MRIRLFVPLPGPFAITSGNRRRGPRQRVGPYGWLWVIAFTVMTVATLPTGAWAFLWGILAGTVAVVVARLLVGRRFNRDAARQDRLRREAAAYEIREAVRRQVQEAADRVSSRRPE